MTTLFLPFPPSVNALYANAPGKGRVKSQRYQVWANAAGWEIKRQRPTPIADGPYYISITLERKKGRRDLGNLHKAVSDLLVKHGVIPDDSNEEVIRMAWSDAVEGCQVTVASLTQGRKAA